MSPVASWYFTHLWRFRRSQDAFAGPLASAEPFPHIVSYNPRNVRMMPDYPGEFEHMVLLAVLRLGDRAYGLKVGDEIRSLTDRAPSSGALYTTLERLERKGYLTSRLDQESHPGRAGRPRRYYSLTPAAMSAMRHSRRALKRLWAGFGRLLDQTP